MTRLITPAVCLGLSLLAAAAGAAERAASPKPARDLSGYHFARDGAQNVLTSSHTSGVRFKSSAQADTFFLYGGGRVDLCGSEGRFDDGTGTRPQELNHAQGCDETGFGSGIWPGSRCWLGVDPTDVPELWRRANAATQPDASVRSCISTLGTTGGLDNDVAWAGRSTAEEPGWATAPGYGNNWNAVLEWKAEVDDPGAPQAVGLEFYFHHDTEWAYDFFSVEYDSFDTTIQVYTVDGSNAPFAAPGVHYPDDVVSAPLVYGAGGYAGLNHDQIILRLRGTSDGAWSDEDGLWPTQCGLAMVDDITVTHADGSTFDDFEGEHWGDWAPLARPFAGDFSQIHPRLTDVDPCLENETPLVAFIDHGQCPVNGDNDCGQGTPLPGGGIRPPPGYCSTTGGSQSPTWSYGIPGGWVVNYTGGLSNGTVDLTNEVWSPPIDWDLPGTTADDAGDVAGSFVRFSVWRHLPLANGIYYTFGVRSSPDGVQWHDFGHTLRYYSDAAAWVNVQYPVTDLLPDARPARVQIRLGVSDYASLWGLPGNDATPSPAFDNVAFCKYRVQGPVITNRTIDLFMDAFPQSGQFDYGTLAGRQNADCRIDMRDVSTGNLNVPGDSMIADVRAVILGTSLERVEMRWVLDKNPLFDDVRGAPPAGTTTIVGGSVRGWDQWMGTVVGDTAKVAGVPVDGRFFFDLPDEDFAHPGDVLRYYLEAEDSDGRVSTLPADVAGFATGRDAATSVRYAPQFTVHMLPSVADDGQGGQTQPWVLVWNDFGFRGGTDEYYQAFEQNGWRCGMEWDMYTTWGPSSLVSNGLGSAAAHGATSDQLGGYGAIVYFAGDLDTGTLSDGSDTAGNDKGNDLATLQGWFEADEDRFVAHFGDDLASALLTDSPAAGGAYVSAVMGLSRLGDDVRPQINDQPAPLVVPGAGEPCFAEEFVAFGGCLGPNDFDNLDALPGARRAHEFTMPDGTTPYGPPGRAASVIHEFLDGGGNLKKSISFPFGFVYVWNEQGSTRGGALPGGGPASQRGRLLSEILQCLFSANLGGGSPVAADGPASPIIRDVTNYPNPYNPSTTIQFTVGRKQHVKVQMYTLRGELVATVYEGPLEAGLRGVAWEGKDDRDVPVSSGVYIARIQGEHNTRRIKTMLVR